MSWYTILGIGITNLVTKRLTYIIPLLWAGMIIGVSLIATPIKFQAPLLDLPTALDVGRVTFAFFNLVEWTLLVTLLALSLINKTGLVSMTLLTACLVLQSFWLLPVLNDRVMDIIQGIQIPASFHHTVYGCIELLKLIVLLSFHGFPERTNSSKRTENGASN